MTVPSLQITLVLRDNQDPQRSDVPVFNVIVSLAAGFKSPSAIQRPLAFVVLAGCTWLVFLGYSQHVRAPFYPGSILAGAMTAPLLIFSDRLILPGWKYEDHKAIFAPPLRRNSDDDSPQSDSKLTRKLLGPGMPLDRKYLEQSEELVHPLRLKMYHNSPRVIRNTFLRRLSFGHKGCAS